MGRGEIDEFVDQMGFIMEESGAPRLMGRLMGYLLVCDPPEQSSSDLVKALGVSKAAISTTTRDLLRGQIIEKVAQGSTREHSFRITTVGWVNIMRARVAQMARFVAVANQGVSAMAEASSESRRRVEDFRDMYAYFEREFPAVIERWVAEQSQKEKR
jgi:DNA-binding transcriptional regulator GbsR (MarR family)